MTQKLRRLWTSPLRVYAIAIHAVINNSVHNVTAMHLTSLRIHSDCPDLRSRGRRLALCLFFAIYRGSNLYKKSGQRIMFAIDSRP